MILRPGTVPSMVGDAWFYPFVRRLRNGWPVGPAKTIWGRPYPHAAGKVAGTLRVPSAGPREEWASGTRSVPATLKMPVNAYRPTVPQSRWPGLGEPTPRFGHAGRGHAVGRPATWAFTPIAGAAGIRPVLEHGSIAPMNHDPPQPPVAEGGGRLAVSGSRRPARRPAPKHGPTTAYGGNG